MKHDEEWRSALKSECGITAEMIESKILEAWDHSNIPVEDVEDAKFAFQNSYRHFCNYVATGNSLLRKLSMVEGQHAFDLSKLLSTKLALDKPVRDGRIVQAGRAKGASTLATFNEKRTAKTNPRDDALWKRFCMLTATGDRDRAEAVGMMVKERRYGSRATIQRVVKKKLAEKSKAHSVT